jgi:hypothetical protein
VNQINFNSVSFLFFSLCLAKFSPLGDPQKIPVLLFQVIFVTKNAPKLTEKISEIAIFRQ